MNCVTHLAYWILSKSIIPPYATLRTTSETRLNVEAHAWSACATEQLMGFVNYNSPSHNRGDEELIWPSYGLSLELTDANVTINNLSWESKRVIGSWCSFRRILVWSTELNFCISCWNHISILTISITLVTETSIGLCYSDILCRYLLSWKNIQLC